MKKNPLILSVVLILFMGTFIRITQNLSEAIPASISVSGLSGLFKQGVHPPDMAASRSK